VIDSLSQERERLFALPFERQCVGQNACVVCGAWMLWPEDSSLNPKSLKLQLFCLVETSFVSQVVAQACYRVQCSGMLRPKDSALDLQSLSVQLLCCSVVALPVERSTKIEHYY
jgi:hypothetical protein